MPVSASEIIATIKRKVQDESYSDAVILGLMNKALLYIANTARPQSLVKPMVSVTVSNSSSPTELPDDMLFPHILAVYDEDGLPIHFSTRMTDLDFIQSTSVSTKKRVALFGNGGMYVFPVNTRDRGVFITYLCSPDPFQATTSVVDIAPVGPAPFTEDAIVAYACREIYNEIEDGIDGRHINTEKHSALLDRAIVEIIRINGQASLAARPEVIGLGIFGGIDTGGFGVL